jgi:hypothetical protein
VTLTNGAGTVARLILDVIEHIAISVSASIHKCMLTYPAPFPNRYLPATTGAPKTRPPHFYDLHFRPLHLDRPGTALAAHADHFLTSRVMPMLIRNERLSLDPAARNRRGVGLDGGGVTRGTSGSFLVVPGGSWNH